MKSQRKWNLGSAGGERQPNKNKYLMGQGAFDDETALS